MSKFNPKKIPEYLNRQSLVYSQESSPVLLNRVRNLKRRLSQELFNKTVDLSLPLGINLDNYNVRFTEEKDSIGDVLYFNKQRRLDSIFLIQIGDFFESFGVDAICLIDVLGLSPMGGVNSSSAKAGFPVSRLDHVIPLILDAGHSVVVIAQTGSGDGQKKKRDIVADLTPEDRILSEGISLGLFGDNISNNSNLIFDEDLDFIKNKINRNGGLLTFIVSYESKGYSYGFISFGKKEAYLRNKFYPIEVIKAQIKARHHEIGSIFFCDKTPHNIFESVRRFFYNLKKEDLFKIDLDVEEKTKNIRISIPENIDKYKINHLFKKVSKNKGYEVDSSWLISNESQDIDVQLNPLTYKTAEELGVIKNTHVFDLPSFVLKDPLEHDLAFLRDILLVPPSNDVRISIEKSLDIIINEKSKSIPNSRKDFLTSKIIKSINEDRLGPSSIEIIYELSNSLFNIVEYSEELFKNLLKITSKRSLGVYDHNLEDFVVNLSADFITETINFVNTPKFLDKKELIDLLEERNSSLKFNDSFLGFIGTYHDFISNNFSDSYSLSYLLSGYGNSKEILERIKLLTLELKYKLYLTTNNNIDFKGSYSKVDSIIMDRENTISFVKAKAKKNAIKTELNIVDESVDLNNYYTTKDKYNKDVEGKYSFKSVDETVEKLIKIRGELQENAKLFYSNISNKLSANINTLRIISDLNLTYSALLSHAKAAVYLSLSKANITDINSDLIKVENLRPYWLKSGVQNNIELNQISVLTGSNASGKSTMLRSLGSGCLLAMCGLRVPASKLTIARGGLSNIFIRAGTSDDPLSGLSSHALEMTELSSIIDNSDERTLVLLDEIGRGCPSASGASIAAASLEHLVEKNVSGLFATHWDEIFTLGSDLINNAVVFRMKNPLDDPNESFKITFGKSEDKMAIEVAKNCGLHDKIINRSYFFEKNIRSNLNNKDEEICKINKKSKLVMYESLLDFTKENLSNLINLQPLVLKSKKDSLPPSFIKGSFLYAIITKDDRLYIGESDDIETRIKTHRSFEEKKDAIFLVFRLENKSQAREFEAKSIQLMAKLGINLISENDGSHSNF